MNKAVILAFLCKAFGAFLKWLSTRTGKACALLAAIFIVGSLMMRGDPDPMNLGPREPDEAPSQAATDGYAPPLVPEILFTNPKNPDLANTFSKASILGQHNILANIPDLHAGTHYTAFLTVSDAKGKKVYDTSDDPYEFRPPNNHHPLLWEYTPDHKEHQPGHWTFRVTISGYGQIEETLEVRDMSPAQRTQYANHEKAREVVFRAFADHWVGSSDLYFTRASAWDGEAWKYYVNVHDIRHDVGDVTITDSDRLNDIHYRSRFIFLFDAFRILASKESRWSRWFAMTESLRSQTELAYLGAAKETAQGILATASKESTYSRVYSLIHHYTNPGYRDEKLRLPMPGLQYEVYAQGKHWFVLDDLGQVFINDIKASQETLKTVPLFFVHQFHKRTALTDALLKEPSVEEIDQILGKTTPSELAITAGRDAAKQARDVSDRAQQTMDALRGRGL